MYEDLDLAPDGWKWSHWTVTLRPPDRWSAEVVGSHRHWKLQYRLRESPGGTTELALSGERRATPLGAKNPPKAVLEREITTNWKNFAAALERDYRASARRSPARVRA
ncbi:MAG: hypothetical protein ACREDE_09140 [Thermoplasmata archaeon]